VKRTSKNTRKKHLTTAILKRWRGSIIMDLHGPRANQKQINIGIKFKKILNNFGS
jgi:hypothetical protein